MLNILTIAYRYDFLKPLYDSIPKEVDITWWICTTMRRKVDIEDKRINIINLDISDDISTWNQRLNILLDRIETGYIQIVDEDTLFHYNAYNLYKDASELNLDIIIGNQYWYNNKLRLIAQKPLATYIDTGSCICKHSILRNNLKLINWDSSIQYPDFHFWQEVWNESNTRVIYSKPISYYNAQLKQETDLYA
jgi:hypothetical protein